MRVANIDREYLLEQANLLYRLSTNGGYPEETADKLMGACNLLYMIHSGAIKCVDELEPVNRGVY